MGMVQNASLIPLTPHAHHVDAKRSFSRFTVGAKKSLSGSVHSSQPDRLISSFTASGWLLCTGPDKDFLAPTVSQTTIDLDEACTTRAVNFRRIRSRVSADMDMAKIPTDPIRG